MSQGVSQSLHYLDDFLTMSPKESRECINNLATISSRAPHWVSLLSCPRLEVRLHLLPFLDILLHTDSMEIRLPPKKLQQLLFLFHKWHHWKHCTKRNLLSLIGKLVHACIVVVAGRIFFCHMINTAHSVCHLRYQIRLNNEFRSDLSGGSFFWRSGMAEA